jgi:hypothetical protein
MYDMPELFGVILVQGGGPFVWWVKYWQFLFHHTETTAYLEK